MVFSDGDGWVKIGSEIAWSAKGNKYGTLTVASERCASEVKFVHKSGYVACGPGGRSVSHAMPAWLSSHVSTHVHKHVSLCRVVAQVELRMQRRLWHPDSLDHQRQTVQEQMFHCAIQWYLDRALIQCHRV